MADYNNVGLGLNVNASAASRTSNSTLLKQVHVQVNFLGHCIFCLRKTKRPGVVNFAAKDSTELLHIVPKAEVSPSSPSLLNTFNRIWLPLQKRIEENGEDDDPFGFLDTSAGGSKSNKSSVFTCLPRLCKFCAEKLEAVDKLLKDLLSEMDGLRKIIQESKYGGKYSWRASEFEAALTNSSMEEGSIRATLKFLDDLGKKSENSRKPGPIIDTIFITAGSGTAPNRNRQDDDNRASRMDSRGKKSENARAEVRPMDTILKADKGSASNHCSEEGITSSHDDADNHPSRMDIDWNPDEREIPCVMSSSAPNATVDPLELPEAGIDATELSPRFDTEATSDHDCGSDPDYVKSEEETDSSSDSEDDMMESTNTELGKTAHEIIHPNIILVGGYVILNQSQDTNIKSPPPGYTRKDKRKNRKSRAPSGKDIEYSKELDAHTGEFKYTCLINGCGKTYHTSRKKPPSALRDHQIVYHDLRGDPTLVCDLCQKTYRGRKAFREHKRVKHGIITMPQNPNSRLYKECELCRQKVPSKNLFQHVQAHVGDDYVIKCPNADCPFACVSPKGLTNHFKSCRTCVDCTPDALTHTCEVCGFTTGHALQLRTHLLNDHETSEKNFQCPIEGCQMRFSVKQSVACHLPHHDLSANITTQMCSHCSTKYKIEEMAEHLKEKHQLQEIIKCHQCPQLFSSRELLVDHLFTHRYGDLTCDICGDEEKFHRHSKLREHYFHVHKVGEQHPCEQCGNVYLTKAKLKWHESQQHSEAKLKKKADEQKEEFMCQECGVIYKWEITLREHNIKHHGAEPYSCTFCSETFTSKTLLNKHERSHKGIQYKDPEFKCDVDGCGKVFKTKQHLQRHKNFRHLNLREHVCEKCGKTYPSSLGLKKHKESVHEGLRPFACDTCGDTFTNGTTLKRHKLIHTGERPYACEICGQKFRQNEVLARHLEAHKMKGTEFKPSGPMKGIRKRVERKRK